MPTADVPESAIGQLLDRSMARHHYSASALIEVLHRAQELYGCLPAPVLETVAKKLQLPPSRVLGVATFYHLFRFEPRKRHCAVVCMGTACHAAGAERLMAVLDRRRGAGPDTWTVETGRCVGSCGLAPIAICDGQALPRLTPEQFEARLKESDEHRVS